MADFPCMKNRSLKAGGRLNRWSLTAGFTVISIHKTRDFEWQTAHTKGCQENRCAWGVTFSTPPFEGGVIQEEELFFQCHLFEL